MIEEIAHFGTASVADVLARLRARQAARKSSHLRELSEWTGMKQRLGDASTVRCGLVKCSNFEVLIKLGGGRERSFKLGGGGGGGSGDSQNTEEEQGGHEEEEEESATVAPSTSSSQPAPTAVSRRGLLHPSPQAWELRAFVGTYAAFKHAVMFEMRPAHLGILPCMLKDSGKEIVLETVANLKGKVFEKSAGLRNRVEQVRGKQAELRDRVVSTVEESRFGKLLGSASSHVSSRWHAARQPNGSSSGGAGVGGGAVGQTALEIIAGVAASQPGSSSPPPQTLPPSPSPSPLPASSVSPSSPPSPSSPSSVSPPSSPRPPPGTDDGNGASSSLSSSSRSSPPPPKSPPPQAGGRLFQAIANARNKGP